MFDFPSNFWNWLDSRIPTEKMWVLSRFWECLVNNYLEQKPTPTLIWMEEFDDDKTFNFILKRLISNGYIKSEVNYQYATLTLNNFEKLNEKDLLIQRRRYRFKKYLLGDNASTLNDIVKLANKYQKSGLIREGFRIAGNNRFQYDTKYIKKYYKYIARNIFDDPDSTIKDVKYEEIVDMLIKYYAIKDTQYYTLGNCIIDSRGRAIYKCTSKIFNPVSHKDARACVKIAPITLNNKGLRAIYAFIAELNGYKGKNINDKICYGRQFAKNKSLPSLENMMAKDSFKKLHERIWLERIYKNLEDTEHWTVAIECDATASCIQVMSSLLGDTTLMDYTNLINPSEFKDAWTIEGLPRDYVKKAMTPRLYGSMQKPAKLWQKQKFEYTQEQINIIENEVFNGRYKRLNDFKNFIINNVHPKETMTVTIGDDTFIIKCNKFDAEKTVTIKHKVFLSKGYYNLVAQKIYEVPDLNSFKRYFVTLLIHNLDSQVANYICLNMSDKFILPNHDAFIVHPNDVSTVRQYYTKKLYSIYKNRKEILINYFHSIGIEQEITFSDTKEIKKFSGYCLK